MFKEADAGYVAYLEDGIKVEMQGGSNMPQYDMQARTHTLALLCRKVKVRSPVCQLGFDRSGVQ